MIHGRGDDRLPADKEIIYMKDAAWPVPFLAGLEYNSPCHGPWNIVHIGMRVPGSHQIYVCGANCNRGVVLTAAEMKASDRYSTLTLFENDLIDGNMESLIIEGVTDIIHKLPVRPPLVFLFTVCVHRFMGVDLDYVYEELGQRFPDIILVPASMEPISQKGGLTPEQRLRDGMHSFLQKNEKSNNLVDGTNGDRAAEPGAAEPGATKPETVNTGAAEPDVSIIGSDFKIEEDSEILKLLRSAGMTVRESSSCRNLDQYLSMGNSRLFLACYPTAVHAVKRLSKRLDTPYLYLPFTFSYEENDRQIEALSKALTGISDKSADLELDTDSLKRQCEDTLRRVRHIIGDTPVAIDAHAVPRFLGLARLLIEHGFRVTRLYGDVFSQEEKEDYNWLIEQAPDLELCSMIHPKMRVFPRGQEEKVLAVGQKAAYFHQTPYFVNIVEGAGLHGYAGIIRLAGLMEDAYLIKKDTKDLVGRKGLGWESY